MKAHKEGKESKRKMKIEYDSGTQQLVVVGVSGSSVPRIMSAVLEAMGDAESRPKTKRGRPAAEASPVTPSEEPPKRRGRPGKEGVVEDREVEEPPKRRKAPDANIFEELDDLESAGEEVKAEVEAYVEEAAPRRRGRPPKKEAAVKPEKAEVKEPPRRRGRPPKKVEEEVDTEVEDSDEVDYSDQFTLSADEVIEICQSENTFKGVVGALCDRGVPRDQQSVLANLSLAAGQGIPVLERVGPNMAERVSRILDTMGA